MDQRQPEYLTPALMAGAVAGILSGIPFVNCLCCLWIIGGGAVAAHLLAQRTGGPLTGGDGAIVGALTGIVAAVVEALVGIPLRAFNREFVQRLMERMGQFADDMPAGWESWLDQGPGASVGLFLLGLFLSAAIFAALGALGGIIGASFSRRRSAPPPPPAAG